LFRRLGYKLDFANNGREALEAVRGGDYHIVFMDINMPEMDGEEATRRIREEVPKEAQPWIIALTANALKGDREHFLEVGMDDYLSKPVKLESLERCLLRYATLYQNVEDAQSAIIPAAEDYGVDLSVLNQLKKDVGVEMLAEIGKEFITSVGPRLEEMLACLDAQDLQRFNSFASSLKAEFTAMGCNTLGSAMGELENWEVLPDSNTAEAWKAHLNDRLQAAVKYISQYLRNQGVSSV